MTTSMQKYTFDAPAYELSSSGGAGGGKNKKGNSKHHHQQHHHRRQSSNHSTNSSSNNDHDPTDGAGSLTYSAASSINSTAGESTDSSFADIMKVLDVQDSKELAAVLHKERARHSNSHFGNKQKHPYHHHHHHHPDERSIAAQSIAADSLAYSTEADSLAYSANAESFMRSLDMRSLATDGEFSGLHGTGILATIAGYVFFIRSLIVVVAVCAVCCVGCSAVLAPLCLGFYFNLSTLLPAHLCRIAVVDVCARTYAHTRKTVNRAISMPMTGVLVAIPPRPHLVLVENDRTWMKVDLARPRIAMI
jgi:hypothetical protein